MLTILATIVVLGVLIFVHELGHFVTAKMVDIEVPRFSIGIGPKVWGFRRGETEYVISALPLGGYVKMAGMEEMEQIEGGPAERPDDPGGDAAADPGHRDRVRTGLDTPTDVGLTAAMRTGHRSRDFESKSLGARTLVISAGVIMNLFFAFAVFALSARIWGVPIAPEPTVANVVPERLPAGAEALAGIPAGARIAEMGGRSVGDFGDVRRFLATASVGETTLRLEDGREFAFRIPPDDTARAMLIGALEPLQEPVVGATVPGMPAAQAGLRAGDRIVRADGVPIHDWRDLVGAVQGRVGEEVALLVERDGRQRAVTVVPVAERVDVPGREPETVGRIGIGPLVPRDHPGIAASVGYGATQTWDVTVMIVRFVGQLVTGNVSPRSLGGPIMIGQISGEVARAGLEPFLNFMALLSINLAVLNLLPIPILDGGHLVFLAVEAVRGRALSLEQRMRLSQVGMFVILAIMVWAIGSDLLRLFGL
jgi:regulator of sigma E protease